MELNELYRWKDDFGEIVLRERGGFVTLRIDNGLQFEERDEHRYHQTLFMLPTLFCPSNEQKVLVLGGGDGLGIRELLKLDHVKSIDLVDISSAMIHMASNHPQMLRINGGSFSDERVNVIIEDGLEFVKKAIEEGKKWDVIILDYPDPNVDKDNPVNKLFRSSHYKDIAKILEPNGIMAIQATSVFISPNVYAKLSSNIAENFSSLMRLVVNMTSFGDIGVIMARNKNEDDGRWDLQHQIPERAFFDEVSLHRLFYFFKDEYPDLPPEAIEYMDISDLIRYDISADNRRSEHNPFSMGTLPYKKYIHYDKETVERIYKSNQNKDYLSIRDIFIDHNILLGYPNLDYSLLSDDDPFFKEENFEIFRNGDKIEGFVKFRTSDNYVENEFIYVQTPRIFNSIVTSYAHVCEISGYKPIYITYWDHNIFTKHIMNKLGAVLDYKGFTWCVSIDGVDHFSRSTEPFSIELGDLGTLNYNGLFASWETDWVETKNGFPYVASLCKERDIPYLAIFSITPPAEFAYIPFNVSVLDYFSNDTYRRYVDKGRKWLAEVKKVK